MAEKSAFKTRTESRDPVEAKNANRKEYVLVRGTHDGINEYGERQTYHAGQLVLLTNKQYLAFADKFTTAQVYEAQKRARKAQIDAANEVAKAKDGVAEAEEELRKENDEAIAKASGLAPATEPAPGNAEAAKPADTNKGK